MKVKELITKLSALNPDMNVLCCNEMEDSCLMLEIDTVGEIEGEITRDDGSVLHCKFSKGSESIKFALISITSG